MERDAPVACRAKRTAAVTALVARRAVPNDLVARLASEAALGTRDANAHARKAAFALLDALAARADPRELLQMLSAALVAQTAHMRAAGLCALSRVVYVCPGVRGDLPALLEAGVLLLGDPATEVQTAALQFLRVATAALCGDEAGRGALEPRLPAALAALSGLGPRGRHRAAVKALVRKWCRVFGHDAIQAVAPATDAPLLKALRRAEARGKRKRTASDAGDAGDDAASSSGPAAGVDRGVAAAGRGAVVRVDAAAAAARAAREQAAAAAAAPPRRRRKATSKAARRGRRAGGDRNRADGVQPYAYDSLGDVARRGKRARRK